MSFRRKNYPEVRDQLLNRLIGGVSGEEHAYPPPGNGREPFAHPLERAPVASVTSVYGLLDGASAQFTQGVDYDLSQDRAKLIWKSGGRRPDAGSVIAANYLPKDGEARVNDLYPGSVARTLLEAVALETAGLYAQMEMVYKAAFIDSAEGGALDHVVALLGLDRVRGGRNSAEVEFARVPSTRGEIFIPAGSRVLTSDGAIEYETLSDVVLADGQARARVKARDLLATNDPVPAGGLSLLAKPIAAIAGVTNPSPSARSDRDEGDAELRARAKSFLAGSERGTLGAIQAAVARHGVLADLDDSTPGLVKVVFHEEALSPEEKLRLEVSVREARPAGVAVSFVYGAAPAKVDLEMRLTTHQSLVEADLLQIQARIRSAVTDYFAKLPVKSPGSVSKLIALAMQAPGVEDAVVIAATVGGSSVLRPERNELDIAGAPTQLGAFTLVDPSLPTGVSLGVRFPKIAAIPERDALQAALEAATAYLNGLPATASGRSIGWGKLCAALPLPGATATTLADLDANPGVTLPAPADRQPYDVTFTFSRPGGAPQAVNDPAAPPFVLADKERLRVASVTVEVKPKVGAT